MCQFSDPFSSLFGERRDRHISQGSQQRLKNPIDYPIGTPIGSYRRFRRHESELGLDLLPHGSESGQASTEGFHGGRVRERGRMSLKPTHFQCAQLLYPPTILAIEHMHLMTQRRMNTWRCSCEEVFTFVDLISLKNAACTVCVDPQASQGLPGEFG